MKLAAKLFAFFFCLSTLLIAQVPGNVMLSGEPTGGQVPGDFLAPVNDVATPHTIGERAILAYDHVREADVMYKKFVWRVVDIREKMNLPFAYPERPFLTVLMEAAEAGKIQLYSTLDDDFTTPLTDDEKGAMGGKPDTITVYDPITYEEKLEIVFNELDVTDVKRFRIKEAWFFDRESSTLKVRILGIAPVIDEYDENGNFLYERPMFWVNYPTARQVLAQEQAYTYGNDAGNRSWEDVLEARYFSSYIFKSSNVYDRRISSYLQGRDALMEGERIKQEIFNYEHDLWSY